jgi:hypothetical protein
VKILEERRSRIRFESKTWGYIKHLTNSEKYSGYEWFIAKNERCPLHYHKVQERTLYVNYGKVKIFHSMDLHGIKKNIKDEQAFGVYGLMEEIVLRNGDNFKVLPGCVYQILATEDSGIYVFATKQSRSDYFELLV